MYRNDTIFLQYDFYHERVISQVITYRVILFLKSRYIIKIKYLNIAANFKHYIFMKLSKTIEHHIA